uniref:DNA primase n=1 Tax=Roseivirga sp. TaxID=1964215 RepID=UPI0040484079
MIFLRRSGNSHDQWDGLMKAALAKGYSEDILEKAGLILKSENKTYDRFRGRVMFPIQNVAGKVIAFGARTLLKDKKQPKYINSPETGVYHKSDIVYGIHQARQAIRSEDLCFLVEGYTDVISMHQSGVANVVSSSGTSLTKEQIQLISRYTKNITVLYDGDNAGIKASFRGINLILENDLNVHAVVFPEGEDPDSFSRSMSSEAYQKFLKDNAQDFITFKTNILTEGGKKIDPIKKVAVIRDIVESIALIPDGIKRSVYIQSCADMLEIDEQVLLSELNKILIQKQRKDRQQNQNAEVEEVIAPIAEPEQRQDDHSTYYVEKECLRMLINYSNEPYEGDQKIGEFIIQETSDIEFDDELIREAVIKSASIIAEGKSLEADMFIGPHHPSMSQLVIGLLDMKYFISELWESRHRISTTHEKEDLPTATHKIVLRLKRKKIQAMIHKNEETLKLSSSISDQDELLRMIKHLKELYDQVTTELGIVVSR